MVKVMVMMEVIIMMVMLLLLLVMVIIANTCLTFTIFRHCLIYFMYIKI